jgi:hypothetical protein
VDLPGLQPDMEAAASSGYAAASRRTDCAVAPNWGPPIID